LERSDNPGDQIKRCDETLKALDMCWINPFRVSKNFMIADPGLSLRSNPGLKLANAFGVFARIFKLMHYSQICG